MARDPDGSEAFVFDLVHSDPGDPGVPSALRLGGARDLEENDSAADGPQASGGAGRGGPDRSLRRYGLVAAVLAIVLGTGLVVDGVRDDARVERMRDVPGGVVDVTSPLEETWSWDGDTISQDSLADGDLVQVAVLGDLLVLETDGGLLALRPATGEEAWTVPLGADPECGPTGTPWWSELVTSAVVCLQGSGPGREVIAVGPDGVASAPRTLEVGDARRHGVPHPGPDGTVLRAVRVGPASAVDLGDAECADRVECTGTVEAGRDLVLRAEDAVTGEVRWSTTVPFRAMEAEDCRAVPDGQSDDGRPSDELDADAFSTWATADLVIALGCGVPWAVLSADGVRLGDQAAGPTSAVSLDTGGYVVETSEVSDDAVSSTLFSSSGEVVAEIAGYVSRPETVDEPDATTLLAADPSGARLLSYGVDGTLRWDVAVEERGTGFLAQVAGTAVRLTVDGTVQGLDLATGDPWWSWDPPVGEDGRPQGHAEVSQAFTDGRSLLLLLHGGSVGAGLVSLDVASGDVVWDGSADGVVSPGQDAGLVAVDGNLMEVRPTGVRGIG